MAKFHRQLSCALLVFSLPTVQLQSDGWACTSFAGELREWVSSEAIRGSGHGQGRGGRWAGGFCWGTDGHSRLPQPVCDSAARSHLFGSIQMADSLNRACMGLPHRMAGAPILEVRAWTSSFGCLTEAPCCSACGSLIFPSVLSPIQRPRVLHARLPCTQHFSGAPCLSTYSSCVVLFSLVGTGAHGARARAAQVAHRGEETCVVHFLNDRRLFHVARSLGRCVLAA